MSDKKYFFGWTNFKYYFKEYIKMYSGTENSFFSHKRVQTGLAFSAFMMGWARVLWYLLSQEHTTILEFVEWAIPLLIICGYTLNKTEQAKSLKVEDTKHEEKK